MPMQDRKELPKTALPRLYFIDRQIASGKYPNTITLAKEYETSTATISRDIAFMRDMLNAPIVFDRLHRGYCYTKKSYRLPAGFASADEMLALGMLKNLLDLYQHTPLYESARKMLEVITAPLADTNQVAWYEDRIIVPQTPLAPMPPKIWDALITALRENHIISFDYRGANHREFEKLHIKPYQLIFDTGAWYLYGYAEERKAIRLFSPARMKNLIISDETFSLPKNYDYRTRVDGGINSYFGVFIGEQTRHFRIAFYDSAAVWIRERQWAEGQTIEEIDRGIIINFTSTQHNRILAWVLSQGALAQPLEPAELVEDWNRQISLMQRASKKQK